MLKEGAVLDILKASMGGQKSQEDRDLPMILEIIMQMVMNEEAGEANGVN